MSGTHHLVSAANRKLRPTAEFETEATRDCHRWGQDDVGKVVKVKNPLKWWLIVSVQRHVATFQELSSDMVSANASEIAFESPTAGETVQSAIDTLARKISAATSASGIANDSSVEGATVAQAFDSLIGIIFGQVRSVFGRTGHVTAHAGDYTAAQVGAPPVARTISAGTGLSGGGDLSANRTLSVSFGSSAGSVCEGNDPRLSGGGAPSHHALNHLPGGSDALASGPASALSAGGSNAEGSAPAFARQDHLHALPPFGSTSATFCQGNDARLSDARTPTSHALSHLPGAADGLAVGMPVAIGLGNDAGSAPAYARADHVHDGSGLLACDGSRPLSGALDLGGNNLTNVGAVFEQPTAFAWASDAATIDVGVKNDFVASAVLTGNSTITLGNGSDGCQGTVYVKQDATGGRGLGFVVPGRTILREAGAMDSNPQQSPNTVTGYAYDFKTIGGTAYVIVERFFLT